MKKIIYLFLLSSSITLIEAARILAVFPTASISHQVVFRPLVHELAKRGHEVILITPDPAFSEGEAPANLTEIDLHDISYAIWEQNMPKDNEASVAKLDMKTTNLMITYFLTHMLHVQLTSDKVQNFLKDKSQKFDLILMEAFIRPALIFSHLYKAPVIQVSSFGPVLENLEAVGAPTHPILYPLNFARKVNKLSLWEKLQEFYDYFEYKRTVHTLEEIENGMLRQVFGPDIPMPRDLVDNVDMIFLNVHPIWEFNRPVPPNVIHIGGLHQKPERELPQDIKNYLDSSQYGVIYMSFGTNVKPFMFPPGTVQIFLKALYIVKCPFKKAYYQTYTKLATVIFYFPYNILWKWNDELMNLPKNVNVSKWYPQADLLRHPNVKLFITQGGLQSTDESITAGVPFVCIPMIGDQWYNAEMYERHNIGVKLDILSLTEENFKNAILTVLNDDSYRQNIIKLREIMNDQPQTSLQRAVWWTEHVLRHGGARHLRAPAANMPWTQYYEVELVAYLLAFLISILVICLLVVKLLIRAICSFVFSKRKVKSH